MKYLITESQFKLISELERDWRDSEYKEHYLKVKDNIIKSISKKIEGYDEDEDRIYLVDSNGKIMIIFSKYKSTENSGEIYYSSTIFDDMLRFLPHPWWLRHGKYIISDIFSSFFPEKEVKAVRTASF